MTDDNAAKWLAAACTATTVETVVHVRDKVERLSQAAIDGGVYLPQHAWRYWMRLVDQLDWYLQEHPELAHAGLRRYFGPNERHAIPAAIRKNAACRLAHRWNVAKGYGKARA